MSNCDDGWPIIRRAGGEQQAGQPAMGDLTGSFDQGFRDVQMNPHEEWSVTLLPQPLEGVRDHGFRAALQELKICDQGITGSPTCSKGVE